MNAGGGRARAAIAVILRLGLGGVLGVAAAGKLADPAGFAAEIANYRLPAALASAGPYVAATLPAVELVVGAGLILLPGRWRRGAAAAALALFAAFAAAVGSAYFRGINIACGCFGGGGDAISRLTLARNAALIAAAIALAAIDRPRVRPRLRAAAS